MTELSAERLRPGYVELFMQNAKKSAELLALLRAPGGQMSYRQLLDTLKALPEDRRAALVVRSMPFGDIIENDTRKVHGSVAKIDGGKMRSVRHSDGTVTVHNAADWQFLAYGLCRAAKGSASYEAAIGEWLG